MSVLFVGTAGRLRIGAAVPAGATVTSDPAEALAYAWRAAESDDWHRTPFVWEIRDGTVVNDVPVTRALALRALRWEEGLAEMIATLP
jgi:hypothetical protein